MDDPRQELARRLRELRQAHWSGMKVTQPQLAKALGGNGRRSVSVPLISSWESRTSPKPPPAARLEDYATFFATSRSFDGQVARLLRLEELTEDELAARDELLQELTMLRDATQGAPQAGPAVAPGVTGIAQSLSAGPYRYTENQDITIVCAQLPPEMLARMPYTNPQDPDFITLYRYSELDSLFELYGHLRAANPTTQVNLRLAHELQPDDYTSHLISLGGVDWNLATRSVLDSLELPVRQANDWDKPGGAYFEVESAAGDGGKLTYRPLLEESGDRPILREDVALFARGVNPFNRKRTVTICNGMYGSGSLGAVRALTDARFRDRNAEYVNERFAGSDTYCILTRVTVVAGKVLTPDWTLAETRAFEWSRS